MKNTEDPLWNSAAELVGGPSGRKARENTGLLAWFTPARVLILLTALSALLGYLIKTPCFAVNWSSPDVFSRACYSDWPTIFTGRGLAAGNYPYLSTSQIEYPVLLTALATITAMVTPGTGQSAARTLAYFNINAVLATAAWVGVVLLSAATAARLKAFGAYRGSGAERPAWGAGVERGAAVALSPAIIATIFINWDIYAILLAGGALWAIVAKRWRLAGVLIGLGTAFKLYPVLLLGVVFLGALRASDRKRAWLAFITTTAWAAGAWALVNVPAMLKDMAGWRFFLDYSREREAGYSSVWFVYNMAAGKKGLAPLTAHQINTVGMLLLLVLLALIVLFAWLTPAKAHPGQLAFLIVAAFLLTNKVYSPQFVMWLVPLAVLAGFSWRWLLAWQFVEVLHWWAMWEALSSWVVRGNSQNSLPDTAYMAAVVAHVLMILTMMVVLVYRQMGKPARR